MTNAIITNVCVKRWLMAPNCLFLEPLVQTDFVRNTSLGSCTNVPRVPNRRYGRGTHSYDQQCSLVSTYAVEGQKCGMSNIQVRRHSLPSLISNFYRFCEQGGRGSQSFSEIVFQCKKKSLRVSRLCKRHRDIALSSLFICKTQE